MDRYRKDMFNCVQCCKGYREEENEEACCQYHCGRLTQFGTAVWYTCCPEKRRSLESSCEVPGCTRGRHKDKHHAQYPYAAYIQLLEELSENAREVWMEMNVQDYITPGKYEWAEVGLSESNKMYVIIGNEERSLDCVEFTAEQLRQLKISQYVALQRQDETGWTAKVEIQSHSFKTEKAVTVTLKPASSSAPVEKKITVYLHDGVPRPGKVSPEPHTSHKPQKTYTIPADTYEGAQLELDVDYFDYSRGRRNDYSSETENGCPLMLQQQGHTTVFSRQCTSDDDKWDNVFTTTIKITNSAREKLIITDVYGEYLNHGEEWVRCDNVLITKDFFPGMFKWCFMSSQDLSLNPGFTDLLTAQLSIQFSDPFLEHCQQGHAHHCLPQPLHLRVTFLTGEEKLSASLEFEQGNPPSIPTQKQREEELERKLLFYLFADDAQQRKRADAVIYYDTPGQLCFHAIGATPKLLWPHLHYAAYQANRAGHSEYELTQLKKEVGGIMVQVFAMVDLEDSVVYALKVVIATLTSRATGYYLVPYIDPLQATFTVEPKEVTLNNEFTVRWTVPTATEDDNIAIYKTYAKRAVMTELNKSALTRSHIRLKAPGSPGVYEVHYNSSLLETQYPGQKSYWLAGYLVVTTT